MDFRNICKKLDVDGIRAKLPPLPAMPLTQLKMPKLKSRKIFRSSRENINAKRDTSRVSSAPPPNTAPSEFINHTPQRISTISSLMHYNNGDGGVGCGDGAYSITDRERERECGTYRSAYSVDDDYPIATTAAAAHHYERRLSRPISPVRAPPNLAACTAASEAKVNMSLMEKLQKGYKDIAEFRLKHIFAKKTVVRKDVIQVDNYVEHYNADRMREQQEQERRDREIADNYRFNFKLSRQRSGHTNSLTSNESAGGTGRAQQPTIAMHESGDESGMEESPPPRRAAAAEPHQVARMRRNALIQDSSTEHDNRNHNDNDIIDSSPTALRSRAAPRSAARRAANAASLNINQIDTDTEDNDADANYKTNAAAAATSKAKSHTLTSIRSNIQQRFQRSIKRSQSVEQTANGSGSGDEARRTAKVSATERIAAQLRKFKSQEHIDDDATAANKAVGGSGGGGEGRQPVQAITTKLKTWKKSFKRAPDEAVQQTDDDDDNDNDGMSPPAKQSQPKKLMRKLKDMRCKTTPNPGTAADEHDAVDNNNDDDDGAKASAKKANTLENRFTQARQRTLRKMQQMSFFHKSQENLGKDQSAAAKDTTNARDVTQKQKQKQQQRKSDSRRSSLDADESEYEQDDVDETNMQRRPEYAGMHARTMWSTNPILADSIESDDCEFPHVVIHQDHSDAYESTLIIAVTRSAMTTPLATPVGEQEALKITEITMHDDADDDDDNEDDIGDDNDDHDETAKRTAKLKSPAPRSEVILPPQQQQRATSIDTTKNMDVWMPKTSKIAVSNEFDEPWKVQQHQQQQLLPPNRTKLYKTKSIDLFENVSRGGAFEDFDDELKNAPIVRITPCNLDSFENESEETDADVDDDGSSKSVAHRTQSKARSNGAPSPTKGGGHRPQAAPACSEARIGNSRESLITSMERHEDAESEDDLNRPPSNAPSPPPRSTPPTAASVPVAPVLATASQERLILSRTATPSPMPSPSLSPPRIVAPVLPKSTESKRVLPAASDVAPPLPLSKPPEILAAPPPPRVPERTTSINRITKPLVKTSSLRLTFDEQVHPSDVGKVNKLITRFEQPKMRPRPRLVPRLHRSESAELTDDDEDNNELNIYESYKDGVITINEDIENANGILPDDDEQSITPTQQKQPTTTMPITTTKQAPPQRGSNNRIDAPPIVVQELLVNATTYVSSSPSTIADVDNVEHATAINIPKNPNSNANSTSLLADQNANYSCASSEYGSPPEYPSSLIGSSQSTPIINKRQQAMAQRQQPQQQQQQQQQLDTSTLRVRRSKRSMTRDDERFFSFDSDEENSYYSISSTGSTRYIVEL